MNWRDNIQYYFTDPTISLILAIDPDVLLQDQDLLVFVHKQGYNVLPYTDPVAFRHVYEMEYRQRWDSGQSAGLVVTIAASSIPPSIPYDLLENGRLIRLSLAELFPQMNYQVLKTLPLNNLNALATAYQSYHGPHLGELATQSFILKHIYGVELDLITTQLSAIKLLIGHHQRREQMPEWANGLLLRRLRTIAGVFDWPLAHLLTSAAEFYNFLQQHWLAYLAAQQPTELLARETGITYHTESILPLSDPGLRGSVTSLFLEGKLTPIKLPTGWHIGETWTQVGITEQPEREAAHRFQVLLTAVQQNLPPVESSYTQWLQFATQWAELLRLRFGILGSNLDVAHRLSFDAFHLEVEDRFAAWLLDRYHTLHNQPIHTGPVMGHHIPAYLAAYRRRQPKSSRIALIVVDGLALDQWLIIHQLWAEQGYPWQIDSLQMFAWIPTLTSIARQAIFAGQPPYLYATSWQTTASEGKYWYRFWQEHGLAPATVAYARNLGSTSAALAESPLEGDVLTLIENPHTQVIGLVINTVDNIAHGMQLGTAGMHQQMQQWLTHSGYLTRMVDKLLTQKFTVFLTSDHGNIGARGIGQLNEGSLVETRGQRARIYNDPELLRLAHSQLVNGIAWSNVGLPTGVHVLLASKLDAFLAENETAVCHGGIGLEEVVVPFVQITSKVNEQE